MKLISKDYPGISGDFLDIISASVSAYGYTFSHLSLRGAVFEHSEDQSAVLFDYMICDRSFPFHYTEYTKEQNSIMHEFRSLYRFSVDNDKELDNAMIMLGKYRNRNFSDETIKVSGPNRELVEIDPTLPEAYFERTFIETYGRESLDKVRREFPVIDINGQTRWIDYYIQKKQYSIAIEKNGEVYHHPITIGKKQYNRQLIKQNSLVAYGIKVFRWSIKGMRFSDNFSEEMRTYLGESKDFFISQKLSISRNFKLFDHQDNVLEAISRERINGKTSFLIVLPTGTGKTEILIADVAREFQRNKKLKTLILVPGKDLKPQIVQNFIERSSYYNLPNTLIISENLEADIVIQTYSWMSRYYQQIKPEQFDYIAVDEAHHAVAPTVQKVIQHFNPSTLIGMTATDKRLDNRKLEDIFGKYETDLSLVEAIEQGLLAPIKAFRVKSNIDLSEIRYNGKDYYSTDLQKQIIVPSRDQLIVDILLKYFIDSDLPWKQGIVFCVSVQHTKDMAKRMIEHGIAVKAVSGSDNKSASYISDYQEGKLQFLITCSLLNEGWDSPQTSIIVMARPTMSQVLYTQQLGRGTRKYPQKEALYVIDVVDNYGGSGFFNNSPWSIHALLGVPDYMPWGNILDNKESHLSREELILAGLYEHERKLEKINIFTFEKEYPDHLSEEQLARELFVSTGTISSWVKKGKVIPDVSIPIGRRKLNYFSPLQINEIIKNMNLKQHNDSTQYNDFFDFIEERNYTMSYKIIMLLSMLKIADHNGECNLDDLLDEYISFYRKRNTLGLSIDRENCPYVSIDFLENHQNMKYSLLKNPFEKFERKRFMYHCKDLNHIAFSNNLWTQISNDNDLNRIKNSFFSDLIDYYKEYDGLPNEEELRDHWRIQDEIDSDPFNIIDFPSAEERFISCVPYYELEATAGRFDMDQFIDSNSENHEKWIRVDNHRLEQDMFAMKVVGHSMEPIINNGDYCLFRAGSALGGSREGRIMLVQHHSISDPDTTNQYTVKRYHSKKVYDDYGNPEHISIILKPINHDYEPIVINQIEDDNEFRVIGEFISVVED